MVPVFALNQLGYCLNYYNFPRSIQPTIQPRQQALILLGDADRRTLQLDAAQQKRTEPSQGLVPGRVGNASKKGGAP